MISYESGQRWINIVLRTLHVAAAAVVFGAVILQQKYTVFHYWHHAMIGSGCALVLAEWLHDQRWPHRGKGLLVQLHALLAVSVHFSPEQWWVLIVWLVLISGCIGSHMPRRFRHWSAKDGWEQRQKAG